MANVKNCIIYLVDSLRFDGYENSPGLDQGLLNKLGVANKLDTPSLNHLSDRGAQVPRLHSPYTSTPPAVSSLLSGLYPREHGMYGFQRPLFDQITLLPEIFKENGFTTLLFNGIQLFEHNGIADRFDRSLKGPPDRLIEEIKRLNDRGEKVFAYFHTMDVHHPYLLSYYPPDKAYHEAAIQKGNELAQKLGYDYRFSSKDSLTKAQNENYPYDCDGDQLIWKFLKTSYHIRIKKEQKINNPIRYSAEWYVEGINNFDKNHLGKIVDFLETSDDDNLFFLTSDHGETVRESSELLGFEHSFKPNQDLIRVPGLIFPGPEAHNLDEWSLTSLVDIVPTLLDLAGVSKQNESLSGYNLNEEPPSNRLVFSEYSDDIEHEEDIFPKSAYLKWHCVLNDDGFKFTRAGTGLTERDFSLPAEEFVRRLILKVAFEPPEKPLVEQLLKQLDEPADKQAKKQLAALVQQQVEGWSPSLVNWREDHFEQVNLLESETSKHEQMAGELEKKLLDRFSDPLEIQDDRTEDDKLAEDEEEKLKDSLEDLGYL